MARVDAGVVTQAQLNMGMASFTGDGSGVTATHWSVIWFGIAVAFILFIYFGFGGLRGQVAS